MTDTSTTPPSDPVASLLSQITDLIPSLRRGLFTTEFWVTVASLVVAVLSIVVPNSAAHLTPLVREWGVVLGTFAPIAYAAERAIIKQLHGRSVVAVVSALPDELLTLLANPAKTLEIEAHAKLLEAQAAGVINDTVTAVKSRTRKVPPPPAQAPAGTATAGATAKP